jgi:tricorn protease
MGPAVPILLITRENQIVRRAGHSERALLSFQQGAIVRAPAPSPNGARMAFVLQPPAGRDSQGRLDFGSDLYVAGRDGSNPTLLLAHRAGEFFDSPAWLPDGSALVFAVRALDVEGMPDYHVETLRLATMQRRRLLDGAAEITLTPDGQSVVMVRTGREDGVDTLELARAIDGSADVLVTLDMGLRTISSPAVSPDGRTVAFAAAGGSGSETVGGRGKSVVLHPTLQDVWLVDIDGENLRRLVEVAQTRASVTWAPDGASLFVLGEEATWRVDVATGKPQKIGRGSPWGQIAVVQN